MFLGLRVQGLGFRVYLDPKVCKLMACRAVIIGLGISFYILLGFRYGRPSEHAIQRAAGKLLGRKLVE